MSPAVQGFFSQISGAYESSAIEVFLIVFAILLLAGGLVAYFVVRSRKEAREKAALARRLYLEKTAELDLSPSQRDLLEQMSHYLRDRSSIHLLVTDQVAFNSAAAQMREAGEATAQTIASLRIALGYYRSRGDKAPKSSAAIPEGVTILVARNKYRRPTKAQVLPPRANSFLIRVLEEGARLPAGAAVDVYYQNDAGVFTFRTTVLAEKNGIASLSHSEDLEKYQKRKYYRRRMNLTVHVYPFDDEKPLLSKFREIGGGGCSLLNPEGHFNVGDNLELRFTPDDSEIRLTGTVVRISNSGKVLHVNYEHIKEGLRDRIYNAIFKPPKDERDEMAKTQRSASTPEPQKESEAQE